MRAVKPVSGAGALLEDASCLLRLRRAPDDEGKAATWDWLKPARPYMSREWVSKDNNV
jgi:hypothetical protein